MVRPERLSPAARRVLTGIWTLAIAGFFVLILVNFIGLVATPSLVIPGIQGIQRGATTDPGTDQSTAAWTFQAIRGGTSPLAPASGGNPGAYLGMSLPGGSSAGVWYQAFAVNGSVPYAAVVNLDILVQAPAGPSYSGELIVGVDRTPGPPVSGYAYAEWYNASTSGWVHVPELDVSDLITQPGTYYLKVAFYTSGGPGASSVGLDNLELRWATNAALYVYLPLPLPAVLFVTQEPAAFIGYFVAIVAAIILSAAYYTLRERKILRSTLLAPAEAIGQRLRSMSAWVAIAQAWMAALFVQVVIIYAYVFLVGQEPPSPIGTPTQATAWPLLFDLANASVYEELVFRALLIGVPMVLGSLLLRGVRPSRPGAAPPPLSHSLKYLLGGQLRQTSSREALLAGWILLFASATVFGVAHAPGWGWWKVVPAFVAGLAFAYLFLRHGIGAAILAHFATDYVSAIIWIGVGGDTAALLIDLLFLGLAVLGAGFFVWYLLEAWGHLNDLVKRFSGPAGARPEAYAAAPWAPAPSGPPTPPPSGAPLPPPGSPVGPYAGGWGAGPAVRDPNAIPQEYVPSYRPPPYGYPPVRFQCPRCGWVEAKYDNGHFTCLRCGQTT